MALALGLRLNVVAMQVANHLVYPAQLLLLVPFVRLGERLTGAERLPLSIEQVTGRVRPRRGARHPGVVEPRWCTRSPDGW